MRGIIYYEVRYLPSILKGEKLVDIQMKRGVLDACVLKALLFEDSYGYKIIKDISPHVDISESTLYPILRRLEADACIVMYSAECNGRLRKYYSITDRGKKRLRVFLGDFEELMAVYRFIEDNVPDDFLCGNYEKEDEEDDET